MKAIGHVSITILTLYAFRISDPIFISGAIVGSIILDADHKKSYAGKLLPFHKIYQHRKQIHSIFYSVLFALLSLFIYHNVNLPYGVFLGCLLHLITDRFTSSVPYLFWYPTKQIKKKKQPRNKLSLKR